MTSAPMVSTRKTQREYSPTFRPNAAPRLYTSQKRTVSPMTSRGYGTPVSWSHAIHLVMTSLMTTAAMMLQKRRPLALLLSIFLTLLAGDAQARVRQRVEPVEVDVLAAAVALAEGLR